MLTTRRHGNRSADGLRVKGVSIAVSGYGGITIDTMFWSKLNGSCAPIKINCHSTHLVRAYSHNQPVCVTHQGVSPHFRLVFKLNAEAEAETTKEPSDTAWEAVASDSACDGRAGESYMRADSAGKVPSIEECKRMCEDTDECQSITYYNTGWCSLFETLCTNTKVHGGATAARMAGETAVGRARIIAGTMSCCGCSTCR